MDALASCPASSQMQMALYSWALVHLEVAEADLIGSVLVAVVVAAAIVVETSGVHALRPVTEAFWAALDLWKPLLVGLLWNPASPFVLIVANCYPRRAMALKSQPQLDLPLLEVLAETEGVVVVQTYCC